MTLIEMSFSDRKEADHEILSIRHVRSLLLTYSPLIERMLMLLALKRVESLANSVGAIFLRMRIIRTVSSIIKIRYEAQAGKSG